MSEQPRIEYLQDRLHDSQEHIKTLKSHRVLCVLAGIMIGVGVMGILIMTGLI